MPPALLFYLNENLIAGAGVRWERLIGDAEDSPAVDDRGDDNQFIGGVGLAFAWSGKLDRNL